MKSKILLSLGLACCLGSYSFGADHLAAKLKELVDSYTKYDLFSGTVLVAKNGEVLFSGGFGEANKDFAIPNDLDTTFNIGSIGKTFTSVSIMQLMQQGKLSLKDPLEKYLPDFPYPEKNTITIHHLLNHTSGLGNYMAHKSFKEKMPKLRQISDVLPLIYDQKPEFPAGKRFRYSNSGMVVLGAIIEKISGLSYPDYLKKHIFEPLGMKRSGIVYREQISPNRSIGYVKAGDNYLANYFMEMPAFSDGGLYTNATDLLLFDQALYGSKLLSEKTKAIMFTPNGTENGYAYGWLSGDYAGHRHVGHGGGAPGINAEFKRFIDDKVTVIVLSNLDGGASVLMPNLEAAIFDRPYVMGSVAEADFYKGINLQRRRQFKEALAVFEKHISGSKPHLRSLYQAARTRIVGKFEEEKAVELLDRYIELAKPDTQPSIGAAWWRKGVAYEQLGKLDQALKCLEKSLQLEPDSESAKRTLEQVKKRIAAQ